MKKKPTIEQINETKSQFFEKMKLIQHQPDSPEKKKCPNTSEMKEEKLQYHRNTKDKIECYE